MSGQHTFPLLFLCPRILVSGTWGGTSVPRSLVLGGSGGSRPSPQSMGVLYFQDRMSPARRAELLSTDNQLLTLSFFGLCFPLLSSVFSPRRSSVALCLCPPHPSSHLVCSSVTVAVKAPPGLPLDCVSENQGCHWPLRPHPFPYTRPGLQHGRCSPTGNPGQFETCLCTDSVLHTKPREALSVLDLCPARGRAHKFSLEEMLNALCWERKAGPCWAGERQD